jgi:hypothetical protein
MLPDPAEDGRSWLLPLEPFGDFEREAFKTKLQLSKI